MGDQLEVIKDRKRELVAEANALRERMSAVQDELSELETAERVLARLLGVTSPPEETSVPEDTAASVKPENTPSIPNMIRIILTEAQDAGHAGMEPREITKIVDERWWPGVEGNRISSIAWRLWKRGELIKTDEDSSVYALPQKKEPPDMMPDRASEGSLFETPAKGREAVPGGGT